MIEYSQNDIIFEIMMKVESNSQRVSLKKMAFQKRNREKELENYFKLNRERLISQLEEYHPLHERIEELMKELPFSGVQLL